VCLQCRGYGYILVYRSRVIREYCKCAVGIAFKEKVFRSLENYESRRLNKANPLQEP